MFQVNRGDKRDDRVKKEGKKRQERGFTLENKKSGMDRVEYDTGVGGASGSEYEEGFSDQENKGLISDDAVAESVNPSFFFITQCFDHSR